MSNPLVARMTELADLADQLPETYRVAAFQELLRDELESRSIPVRPADGSQNRDLSENSAGTGDAGQPAWFDKVVDALPEPHAVPALGRDAETVWAVIELFRRKRPADVASIRTIIKDELGTSPESRGNTSARLGKLTQKFLRREKEGRGYVYFPIARTSELFKED